ncbi:MAG: TrmH family RNA methyltransferase [Anaerolineaceae bacterium]
MITSDNNPKIQLVRSLINQSKARKHSSLFVVEGLRLVEEAVTSEWNIQCIFYSSNLSERGIKLIEHCKQKNIQVEEITLPLLEKFTETKTPQGILGVIHLRELKIPEFLDFVLICDAIRDPGNLGTMIRTAAAAGVQAVLLAPGTTDAFAPKVIRSGMGAHFNIPILQMGWNEIIQTCHSQTFPLKIIGTMANAEENCWQINLRQPSAIIVGGEADGMSKDAIQITDKFVSIPMPGRSESLNAAIAASILLFEAVRQRSK